MKRLTTILLIFTLLFACVVYADSGNYSNNDKIVSAANLFIDKISYNKDFSIWEGQQIGDLRELYNVDGELSAYLVTIENDGNIIGYTLVNPEGKVIEYALGQSPYDDYLQEYINQKGEELKGKHITLLYDGPTLYGITADEGKKSEKEKKVIQFTRDSKVNVKVDTLKHVKELQDQNNSNNLENNVQEEAITILSTGYITKTISGVPYYDVYNGCGATAGYHIVKYWDTHGYSNLITYPQTSTSVIDELHDNMNSFVCPWDPDQIATWPEDYAIGLQDYLDGRYSGTFTVHNYPASYGLVSYDVIKSEVNYTRPGTVLYMDNEYYGSHYVTFMGYSYSTYDDDYDYVIHDGWTSTDVYRDWYVDEPSISYLYKIIK